MFCWVEAIHWTAISILNQWVRSIQISISSLLTLLLPAISDKHVDCPSWIDQTTHWCSDRCSPQEFSSNRRSCHCLSQSKEHKSMEMHREYWRKFFSCCLSCQRLESPAQTWRHCHGTLKTRRPATWWESSDSDQLTRFWWIRYFVPMNLTFLNKYKM